MSIASKSYANACMQQALKDPQTQAEALRIFYESNTELKRVN